MSKLFHRFFDSYRVKDEGPTIVHIGRNNIGSITLFPSDTNPFIDGHGYVTVYDNGELYCDEHLAKLITYTDSHNEFMEFCFDLWKNKTVSLSNNSLLIFHNSSFFSFILAQQR